MQRTVVVISAGLGVPSSTRMLADQLGAEVQSQLQAMGVTAVLDVIDLRNYATDIANNMVSGYAGPALAEVVKRVEAADAMIAVTPTFSASYSGLFKSFFDVLDPKFLDGMPVLFGATGGSSRHSLVLDMSIRPLFSYLRANTMPTAIYASPEDWGGAGSNTLERRISQGAGELAAVLAIGASAGSAKGSAQEGPQAVFVDHKEKRAQREMSEMTSLPFEELLAQTQRR
ncbi:FMN reductase [Arthrobacter alpinus]|uniref:FMN reductase n=2 Tax=Arthrobacter alpinus TaxID=656366 RepID=A0A1H5L329_9MICC|nr:FMN reductase [Arthrobacter alpinus]SEE71485.1 FMN reductase [Arthrobacter alpinus]